VVPRRDGLRGHGKRKKILNRDCLDRFRERVSTAPDKKIAAVEKARYYLDRFVNEERVFRDLFFALAAR